MTSKNFRPNSCAAFLGSLAFLLSLASGVSGASEIEWARDFESALQEATAEKKFVMVDFYTGWCHWCKVLDRDTYSNSAVVEFANDRFVNVKVNADKVPALAQKYRVRGYPTILFLHPDGSVKKVMRGFQPPEVFRPAMEKVTNTKAQQFTLSSRISGDPENPDLRRIFAQVLALSGDYHGAVAQSDTCSSSTLKTPYGRTWSSIGSRFACGSARYRRGSRIGIPGGRQWGTGGSVIRSTFAFPRRLCSWAEARKRPESRRKLAAITNRSWRHIREPGTPSSPSPVSNPSTHRPQEPQKTKPGPKGT